MDKMVPLIVSVIALIAIGALLFTYVGFLMPDKMAITFDVEYPYGIDENTTAPSEQQWKVAVQEILFTAKRNEVKFQFNILGKTAEAYPDIIRQIADEGHGVSCHSYSHVDFITLNETDKYEELVKCRQVVENVTDKKIKGNRFPYTKWDTESFAALDKAGYKWDSSVWADQTVFYMPSSIREFQVANMHDDWTYFIYQENTDAKQFYEDFVNDKKNEIYVVVLHPWVQAMDDERLKELDNFVKDQKAKGTMIASLDDFY